MIVYFLTCGVIVVVVFAFASPCTGAKIYFTPATNHQSSYLCYYHLVLWGLIYERAQPPFVWIPQITRKKHAPFSDPPSPSTSGCVLRINHRFSIPFERLAGGHLVQGTSSLLLIACDHVFYFYRLLSLFCNFSAIFIRRKRRSR